jgi:hypothetical protein
MRMEFKTVFIKITFLLLTFSCNGVWSRAKSSSLITDFKKRFDSGRPVSEQNHKIQPIRKKYSRPKSK